ncbi:preprotein translocase subunit SecE [Angustibacter sp. McL0619]|uniref:preprotein translocase subunit SecE n=1 Tax=Angustibacter sp. McL0619 TaxID=3415676 RepID=UPI003CF26207
MSQTSTGDMGRSGGKSPTRGRRGPFARMALFFRQVMSELRKVVRPTRNELITYTTVCMVFVVAVMTFVALLDVGLGAIVVRVFGGKSG